MSVTQVVGRRAWLVGLANAPGLNGKQGTIMGVQPDINGDQRFHLKLDQPNQLHQEEVKAKPQNISFTPPATAAAAAPAAAAVPAVSTVPSIRRTLPVSLRLVSWGCLPKRTLSRAVLVGNSYCLRAPSDLVGSPGEHSRFVAGGCQA
jgi:hypothetical protein